MEHSREYERISGDRSLGVRTLPIALLTHLCMGSPLGRQLVALICVMNDSPVYSSKSQGVPNTVTTPIQVRWLRLCNEPRHGFHSPLCLQRGGRMVSHSLAVTLRADR